MVSKTYGVAKKVFDLKSATWYKLWLCYARSMILDKPFNLFGSHSSVLEIGLRVSQFLFVDLIGPNWLF